MNEVELQRDVMELWRKWQVATFGTDRPDPGDVVAPMRVLAGALKQALTMLGENPAEVVERERLRSLARRTWDVLDLALTDAKDPEYLFTVRGVGYRFRDVV